MWHTQLRSFINNLYDEACGQQLDLYKTENFSLFIIYINNNLFIVCKFICLLHDFSMAETALPGAYDYFIPVSNVHVYQTRFLYNSYFKPYKLLIT